MKKINGLEKLIGQKRHILFQVEIILLNGVIQKIEVNQIDQMQHGLI